MSNTFLGPHANPNPEPNPKPYQPATTFPLPPNPPKYEPPAQEKEPKSKYEKNILNILIAIGTFLTLSTVTLFFQVRSLENRLDVSQKEQVRASLDLKDQLSFLNNALSQKVPVPTFDEKLKIQNDALKTIFDQQTAASRASSEQQAAIINGLNQQNALLQDILNQRQAPLPQLNQADSEPPKTN